MDEVDRLRAHEDRRDRWMALVRRDEQSTGDSATA
jgi:hypothetical protein